MRETEEHFKRAYVSSGIITHTLETVTVNSIEGHKSPEKFQEGFKRQPNNRGLWSNKLGDARFFSNMFVAQEPTLREWHRYVRNSPP